MSLRGKEGGIGFIKDKADGKSGLVIASSQVEEFEDQTRQALREAKSPEARRGLQQIIREISKEKDPDLVDVGEILKK